MVEGGENKEGTFLPLDDPMLKGAVTATGKLLDDFKQMTVQRYNIKQSAGSGSEIDQQYDRLFNDFIHQIDDVEKLLQQKIAVDYNNFKIVQISLIFFILLSGLLGFFLLYKYGQGAARTDNRNKRG